MIVDKKESNVFGSFFMFRQTKRKIMDLLLKVITDLNIIGEVILLMRLNDDQLTSIK